MSHCWHCSKRPTVSLLDSWLCSNFDKVLKLNLNLIKLFLFSVGITLTTFSCDLSVATVTVFTCTGIGRHRPLECRCILAPTCLDRHHLMVCSISSLKWSVPVFNVRHWPVKTIRGSIWIGPYRHSRGLFRKVRVSVPVGLGANCCGWQMARNVIIFEN